MKKIFHKMQNMVDNNNNKKRVMAKDVKLSLTDSLLLGIINALVEAGYSMTRIIDIASNSGNSASDSSKNKKRVKELLNYIENKDILEQNNAQQKEVIANIKRKL